MRKGIVAAALLLAGCAPDWTPAREPAQDTTWVCVSLPREDDTIGAMQAVNLWDRAIGKWKHLQPVRGSARGCRFQVQESEPAEDMPDALAYVRRGDNTVHLVKGRYHGYAKELTVHEIGHLLGGQHVEGTAMNSTFVPHLSRCPDAVSVIQVAAANGIPLSWLSWCY